MGLLADTATDKADLMAKAKAWIAANPEAQQPWDNPKFKWPGGDSRSEGAKQLFAIAPSIASAKSYGNYPAVKHIMSSVFEGGLLDFDTRVRGGEPLLCRLRDEPGEQEPHQHAVVSAQRHQEGRLAPEGRGTEQSEEGGHPRRRHDGRRHRLRVGQGWHRRGAAR